MERYEQLVAALEETTLSHWCRVVLSKPIIIGLGPSLRRSLQKLPHSNFLAANLTPTPTGTGTGTGHTKEIKKLS